MRLPIFCLLVASLLGSCDMVQVYQGQIDKATRAIDAATTDAARAAAYADRGRGYSDKARLSYVRKQIDRGEYLRLFDLAVADHDRAVKLASADAQMYFLRGLSYYDRAFLVEGVDADHTPWTDAARSDFGTASRIDSGLAGAYDYLGLVDEQTKRYDEAIADYTHVLTLDARLGKLRLAELYCDRGLSRMTDKRYDLAAADLEKSIAMDAHPDGCSCEPYGSLAYIYIDATGQYDKGWDLVRKAASSGQFIAPEYIEKLAKASGRRR